MNKLSVFTDGGARNNPGPAAVGVVIKDEQGKIICRISKKIGETTNNVAEYKAVVEALKWLVFSIKYKQSLSSNKVLSISFFLDSRLVVNQINGLFKIKDSRIRDLIIKVHELEKQLDCQISYTLIPREQNYQADGLVNQALNLIL